MSILHHLDTQDKTISMQQNVSTETLTKSEPPEAISVWETSRRRSQRSRYSAAQARTQGRRRQLRRWWGRGR